MKERGEKLSRHALKWLLLCVLIGSFSGGLSAFFLQSLTVVTQARENNPWLLLLLPLGGMIFAYLYETVGKNALKGNNLIIEQANGAREDVPLRLIPLTLFGTLTSHLFGGSVGREGTAVQMGGAVAGAAGKLFSLDERERRILFMCGISAGFSGVFGTPLAGTLFALEVLALSSFSHVGLLPSLVTAWVADLVATFFGATHNVYQIGEVPAFSVKLVVLLVFFGLLFGLTSRLFSRSLAWLKSVYAKLWPHPVWRNGLGALVVLLLVWLFQTTRYNGLSLPLLEAAFSGEQLPFDFINKLILTVFSLGAGFQGGEVTPLFEIGATLGSNLAFLTGLPVSFVAALGFIGVFAGASNTPIASFVMGLELFGSQAALGLLLVCFVSYGVSGQEGIYSSQLRTKSKFSILTDL